MKSADEILQKHVPNRFPKDNPYINAMEEYASQFREKPKNKDNEIIFYNLKPDKGDFIPIIQNWLSYKTQKRQTYKPIGLKTLIKKFNEFKGTYSELESLVENSIINNYSGIIWDKKVNNGNQQQSTYEKHEQGFDALFGSGSPFSVPES